MKSFNSINRGSLEVYRIRGFSVPSTLNCGTFRILIGKLDRPLLYSSFNPWIGCDYCTFYYKHFASFALAVMGSISGNDNTRPDSKEIRVLVTGFGVSCSDIAPRFTPQSWTCSFNMLNCPTPQSS